jgi:hypothetical protein
MMHAARDGDGRRASWLVGVLLSSFSFRPTAIFVFWSAWREGGTNR